MPEFNRWFADKAEHLRYEYDLNENSIVMDLGLYEGKFAKTIADTYKCFIYGFEPVKRFFENSQKELELYPKIKLFNYGIGNTSRFETIYIQNDASSVFTSKGSPETIQIRSVAEVIAELGITSVDLIKINVEGAEYEILDAILANDLVKIFKNIQVQFHTFYPKAEKLRNHIRKQLMKTHKTTYDYEFVWENWKLR